jgi:HEPN domain-containing protein
LALGGIKVTRLEWQQLAERWLVDAKRLLDDHRWSAAYYLAGYAVECGLKACVLVHVAAAPEVIFGDKKFSEKCWTHSLLDLVKMANLEGARAADAAANPALGRNWLVVKDWSEKARYNTTSHQKAKKLYDAITDNANGVMQWIRVRW